MVGDTVVAEELTAMRKAFLYEKTHSYNLRTGLPAEMNNTACGMPVRQEIINEFCFFVLSTICVQNYCFFLRYARKLRKICTIQKNVVIL